MASYTATDGVLARTFLAANTVDTVTVPVSTASWIVVRHRGFGDPLYVSIDGSTPSVGSAGFVIPAAKAQSFPVTAETVVKIICAAAEPYSVERSNNDGYEFDVFAAPLPPLVAPGSGGGGGDMSAAEILAALLTVDGAGSGLDADTLDGNSSAAFAAASHNHAASAITSGTVDTARLGSGTANSSAFLRGDQAWATPETSDPLTTVASSGASYSANIANAGVLDITLTGNCTLSVTGISAGAAFSATFILRQDGTGSRTVTWPGSTKWAGGAAPTLSTAASSIDVVSLITVDGGTTWLGFLGGKAFA